MSINDLPLTFLLTDGQKHQLISLTCDVVINHVQVLHKKDQLYHLNPDLVFDMEKNVLCPICAQKIQCQWQRTKRVLLGAMTMVSLEI